MEKIQEQDGERGRAKAAGLAVNIWRSGPDVQGEIAASLLQDLLPPVSSRLHHGDNLMRAATRGQIHYGFVNPLVGINGQITFPLSRANIHAVSGYKLLRNNQSSLINADLADDVSTGA